ncbi:MAG: mechanosensitive ion channel family protein [Clostridia bacterium]|nr:mechanosensitive ion channel family protein [Clostridia bacterium]
MINEILKLVNAEFSPEKISTYLANAVEVVTQLAAIIIIAVIINKVGTILLDKMLQPRVGSKYYFDEKRAVTLNSLAKSTLRYGLYFFVGIAFLETLFPKATGPVLASAGVVGLAVGFGAQNLVRDVITGFFIILENQFAVGEYITTAGLSGVVEEMGLRVTKLRDFGGELHIIPNGQIQQVTNFNRGSMRALVDIGVAYEEDLDRVVEALNQVVGKVKADLSEIIHEGPEVLGVVNFGPSEVVIRIIAKAKPMEQWRVERELRKQIKEIFAREDIEIPYPRRVMLGYESQKTGPGNLKESGLGG